MTNTISLSVHPFTPSAWCYFFRKCVQNIHCCCRLWNKELTSSEDEHVNEKVISSKTLKPTPVALCVALFAWCCVTTWAPQEHLRVLSALWTGSSVRDRGRGVPSTFTLNLRCHPIVDIARYHTAPWTRIFLPTHQQEDEVVILDLEHCHCIRTQPKHSCSCPSSIDQFLPCQTTGTLAIDLPSIHSNPNPFPPALRAA